MTHFTNGVRYDYSTGQVKFYMTKPRDLEESLKGRKITIDGTELEIDEFPNRKGITMLSFTGKIVRRFTDFQTAVIYIRCRITNEVQSLSVEHRNRK